MAKSQTPLFLIKTIAINSTNIVQNRSILTLQYPLVALAPGKRLEAQYPTLKITGFKPTLHLFLYVYI